MTVFARSNNKEAEPVATDPVQDVPAVASRQQAAPPPPRPSAGPSLISAALTVIGQLQSAGDIQIDGKIEGDVRGHTVRIGSDAVIKGTVFGDGVELSGTIEGKIEARKVVLLKTARMTGDILHQSLQIDEGARFGGNSMPNYAKNGARGS